MKIRCPNCKTENTSDSQFCKKCATPLPLSEDISVTKTLETPAHGLATGTAFAGRYQIIEEIGKGGMGAVYKALDTQINEEVALKLIRPEIASDDETLERFSNELKLARKIGHKNVCKMFHLEREGETPYISMEYLEGEDLKQLIQKKGKLTPDEAIGIAKQVCEGLAEAHRLGIVHRDLKPQNIMMDKEGNAKIMDFGIARSVEAPGVTATGVIIGTPDYISPEQAEGQEADHRSDIYSLGVILYEMVTGSVPFKGDTALSVALKHKSQLPLDPRKLNPEVSDDLSRLILICMEKDRERRYQTAEALFDDLRNLEQGLPLGTRTQPRRATFIQTLIRKKLFIPASVLVIAVISAGAYFVFGNREPNLDPNRIVVAIFENRTGNPAYDFIGHIAADSITQGLQTLDQTGAVDIVPSMLVGQVYNRREGEDLLGYLLQYTKAGTVVAGNYYLQGDSVRIHAEVTDARGGKLIKALDPVSGPIEDSTKLVEIIRQQIMLNLAIFKDPDLKNRMEYIPPLYEAYKEFIEGRNIFFKIPYDKRALDHFLKAAQLDPDFARAKLGAALVYMNSKNYPQADALVKELDTMADKIIGDDYYNLDWMKARLRGDNYGLYRVSIQWAESAPNPLPQYLVGQDALLINRPKETINRWAKMDPEVSPLIGSLNYWIWLTAANHMLGHYKQELKEARRWREQYPDSSHWRWPEIRALIGLGKIKEVNESLDEFITLRQPSGFPFRRVLSAGGELRAHGYKKEALEALERGLRWLEGRPEEEQKRYQYWHADLLYNAERWDEALPIWEAIQIEYPDDPETLGRVGTLAARQGDRDEALRISALLEEIETPYLYGRQTLCRAHIAAQLGDKEAAMSLLKEALAQGAVYQCPYSIMGRFGIYPNMDLEPLYDYPPFQELIKPKG